MAPEIKLILLAIVAIIEFPIVLFIGYQIGKYSQEPLNEKEDDSEVIFTNETEDSEDIFPPKIEGDANDN